MAALQVWLCCLRQQSSNGPQKLSRLGSAEAERRWTQHLQSRGVPKMYDELTQSMEAGSHIVHASATLRKLHVESPVTLSTCLDAEQDVLHDLVGRVPDATFFSVEHLVRLQPAVTVTHGNSRHYSVWLLRHDLAEQGQLQAAAGEVSAMQDGFPRTVVTLRPDILLALLRQSLSTIAFTSRTLCQKHCALSPWLQPQLARVEALPCDVPVQPAAAAAGGSSLMSFAEIAQSVRHWRNQLRQANPAMLEDEEHRFPHSSEAVLAHVHFFCHLQLLLS